MPNPSPFDGVIKDIDAVLLKLRDEENPRARRTLLRKTWQLLAQLHNVNDFIELSPHQDSSTELLQ
jgi:hypothetical protein